MITAIEIKGFKSLENVHLKLAHLNLFIGTNASGKSNFFDALRLLQGIGYGFTIDEILNGKPKSANSEVWESLRGGSSRADFISRKDSETDIDEQVISIEVDLETFGAKPHQMKYCIGISAQMGCLRSEMLQVDGRDVYNSEPVSNYPFGVAFGVRYYHGKKGTQPNYYFEKSRPVLHQLYRAPYAIKAHIEAIESCIKALSNTQRIDPSPTVLRDYSHAHLVKRMGERGENFAALVKAILMDEKAKSAYLTWLKQLTPTEVDDVEVLKGALEEPLFALRENGKVFPAQILSDGTLRFAAIAAAFFQPDMPDILTVEEIENGIHPSRLRLLVELLKSQSVSSNLQIMATTHSPIVLSWLKKDDYATTFFCKRSEETGASLITPLKEVPGFQDIVDKHLIGDLFSEGWLEGAL